jgi:tetratricopeptide (TPR) repeat protein
MYRRVVLIAFGVLVTFSVIYALMDRKKVTTSSDEAYRAYLDAEELRHKLYTKEALHEYERAVEFDPDFAMATARMAWLYYEFGRKDEYLLAREKVFTLLDDIKDIEKIQIQIGFAEADGNWGEAEKYISMLMEKFPESLEAHNKLAHRLWSRNEIDSSITEFWKVLDIDPGNALAYNMLGYLYYFRGEYDKALEYINKYSTIARDQANPHDSHGEILLWLGRYDEALTQFQIADSIKPDLFFVIGHMGQVYWAKGMFRDAIGALLRARELAISESGRIDFELRLADCYLYTGHPDDAIEVLEEAIARSPKSRSLHALLGRIYALEGRVEEAFVELGTLKGMTAEYNSKRAADDTTVAKTPLDQRRVEAQIAVAKGELDKAIAIYNEALSEIRLPYRQYYAHLLAETYVMAQMPDSAVSVLMESLKDNPNYPLSLMTLADAYKAMGQATAQREALNRLLAVLKDADEGNPNVQDALAELNRLNEVIP